MTGNYYIDKIHDLEEQVRSEKGAKAGYKSAMLRIQKEKEQLEFLLYHALLEIKKLKSKDDNVLSDIMEESNEQN